MKIFTIDNIPTRAMCYMAPQINAYSYMKTFRKSDSVARNKTSSASNKKKS